MEEFDLEFVRLRYSGRINPEAMKEVDLPEVIADSELQKIFAGNEFDVTFDTYKLAQGATDLGIKNHVSVVLIKSDEDESTKPISFRHESFSRDTVFIEIEYAPKDIKEAQKIANIRFWAAVLASNILDQPLSAQQELAKLQKNIRRKALKRKIGGGVLTGAGIVGRIASMTGKIFIPTTAVVARQGAGGGGSFSRRRKEKGLAEMQLFSEAFDQKIIHDMMPLAIILAKEYPVIDYTTDRPLEE